MNLQMSLKWKRRVICSDDEEVEVINANQQIPQVMWQVQKASWQANNLYDTCTNMF